MPAAASLGRLIHESITSSMPPESFVARTAEQGMSELKRAEQAWISLASSKDPLYMAMALRWFGRHFNEYVWRFHASMQVDAIGQQLHEAPLSTPCQGMEQQGAEKQSHAA